MKLNLLIASPKHLHTMDNQSIYIRFGFGSYRFGSGLRFSVLIASPKHLHTMDNQIIDEDLAIKAVIEAAALDYSISDSKNPYSWKREGYAKTNRCLVSRAKNCDYKSWVEARTPPAGYLCCRCKLPGHLIQHCPTNGDSNYDFKRMKPATGMPKSMSKGKVAVLQPNEAEFEKMVDCLPTKHVVNIPKELHCPLCKRVMQDAALTSKCCFKSYCDECIRDYTISRNVCACGAPSKVDDLIPNVTVRSTIARYLSLSNDSSGSPNEIQSTTNNAKPKAHSSKSSNKDTINAKSEEKIEAKTTNMPETITESVKEPSVGKKLKKRKLPQAVNAGMQSVNCMMPYQPIDYYTYMSNYGVGNYDVAYCGMPLQNYQIPTNCYMMPAVSQSELSKDWIANNKGNGKTKAKLASHLFIKTIILNIFAFTFFIAVYSYVCMYISIVFNMNITIISRKLKMEHETFLAFFWSRYRNIRVLNVYRAV